MNQKEIDQWRKGLDDTREHWKKRSVFWEKHIYWQSCPLCRIADAIRKKGPKTKQFCSVCIADEKILGESCDDVIDRALDCKSRRPIFDALRKLHKHLDEQENKNKKREKRFNQ